MRSKVVSQRDIREKYGAEVKEFHPAFVIPRRHPGWEESGTLRPRGSIFRPVFPAAPATAPRPAAIETAAMRLPATRRGR
jgi:hypothetical protein